MSPPPIRAITPGFPPGEPSPADSLILYNDWFTADDGLKLSRSTLQEKLTDNIPLRRQFAIGGAMVSGEKLGARTGELLQQVLRGASPSSLPIREMETEQRFDYRKLQLPSGSVVLNQPPSPGNTRIFRCPEAW